MRVVTGIYLSKEEKPELEIRIYCMLYIFEKYIYIYIFFKVITMDKIAKVGRAYSKSKFNCWVKEEKSTKRKGTSKR